MNGRLILVVDLIGFGFVGCGIRERGIMFNFLNFGLSWLVFGGVI